MPRLLPRLPFFKLLAVAQTAMLARRHYQRLNARERRRLRELVRRGHRMNRCERNELIRLVGKLEPRSFAVSTADAFSPLPLPRRFRGQAR
jgi:hypothetical protein